MEVREKTMDQSTYAEWQKQERVAANHQSPVEKALTESPAQNEKARIVKKANWTLSAVFCVAFMALVLAYMLGIFGNKLDAQTFSASLITFLLIGLKLVDDLSPAIKIRKEKTEGT